MERYEELVDYFFTLDVSSLCMPLQNARPKNKKPWLCIFFLSVYMRVVYFLIGGERKERLEFSTCIEK